MEGLDQTTLERAFKEPGLPQLRQLCLLLTLTGAFFLCAPVFLSVWAPRPLPPLDQLGPSLDPLFGFLALVQMAAFGGMLFLHRVWRLLVRKRPKPGQAWDPMELAIALRQNWLIRFGLAEGICVLGGMGYYLAYQQGLLGVAQRTWMLGLLPLGALAWMLMNWPDDERLKAAYLNS